MFRGARARDALHSGGGRWDQRARDAGGALLRAFANTVDGQFQTFAAKDGRFNRDNLDSFRTPLDLVCIEAYCYEQNFRRLEALHARQAMGFIEAPNYGGSTTKATSNATKPPSAGARR